MDNDSTDEVLIDAMTAIGPSGAQILRMGRQIEGTVKRVRIPLWTEWLDLFQVRPVRSTALVLAGACVLLLTTPLGSLLRALM